MLPEERHHIASAFQDLLEQWAARDAAWEGWLHIGVAAALSERDEARALVCEAIALLRCDHDAAANAFIDKIDALPWAREE